MAHTERRHGRQEHRRDRRAARPAAGTLAGAFDEFPSPEEILRVIWRQKLLIALIVLPLTLLAAGYGALAPARYRATAVLALVPKDAPLSNLGATPGQLIRDMPVLATQIEVIQSPSVLGEVVDRLDLQADAAFTHPISAKTRLIALARTALVGLGLNTKGGFAAEIFDRPKADAPPPTREELIRSLADGLSVEQAGQSYALTVSYTGTDPALAASIVNETARAFVRRQLADKLAASAGAAGYLSTRLAELRREVEQTDASLERYRAEHGLPVDGAEDMLSKRVNTLNTELIGVRSEIAVTEARVQLLEKLRHNPDPTELARALDTGAAQALQLEEVALARRRAELLASYGERHPLVQALRADQAALRQKIRNEAELSLADVQRGLDLLHVKEAELSRAIKDAEDSIAGEQHAIGQVANLKRDADVNRKLYEELLTQQKLVQERQALIQPDVQVISEASADIRSSAPPFLFFPIVAFVGSFGLAALLALILDRRDGRIRSARQLEHLLGLPVLGRLPTVRQFHGVQPARFVSTHPASAYTEGLRQIYHALDRHRRDGDALVVLLTSTAAGEGKSSTIAGLAGLLSHSGKRVAVIDLDLRRPRLARLFDVDPFTPTINDLLVAPAEVWVRRLHALTPETFTVIPARASRDDILPLLGSRRLGATVKALRLSFDYVLIDTPPVLPTSDACFLARHADVSVLACAWLKTEITAVRESAESLSAPGLAPLVGLVLNMIEPSGYRAYAASYGEQLPTEGRYLSYP